MEKFLFRFEQSLKSKAQIMDYNLAKYYDVYSIVNSNDLVTVKWNIGLHGFSLVYEMNEVERNIKEGKWVKIDVLNN